VKKKITNYNIQIKNKFQITMSKITNKKLIKSFCGCFTVQGAVFTKSAPWPPEAKKEVTDGTTGSKGWRHDRTWNAVRPRAWQY
jgi:hypothetical protein